MGSEIQKNAVLCGTMRHRMALAPGPGASPPVALPGLVRRRRAGLGTARDIQGEGALSRTPRGLTSSRTPSRMKEPQ